jgi:hypothetical protein
MENEMEGYSKEQRIFGHQKKEPKMNLTTYGNPAAFALPPTHSTSSP